MMKYSKERGFITDVKHFAIHDGDGIRTTVFFKGCPLKCVWCHNPECISADAQEAFYSHKCINCGECQKNGFVTEDCLGRARLTYGREIGIDELLSELLQDRDFYENTNGGITLSGGECLLQADFCAELLKRLKQEGINTAVDTCGCVPWSAFEKVLPYTDVFLYDLKAVDEQVHKKCTGLSNKLILDNLSRLDLCGASIEIRIPYVSEYNNGEIGKMAELLSSFKNISEIKVLPYHDLAKSKYDALKMENTLPSVLPADAELDDARALIRAKTGFECQ